MTRKDVEYFKTIIPQKIDAVLKSEIGEESLTTEIKIQIDWNLYNEPVITTTTKNSYTDVLYLPKKEV
jgi:hypothetical protein